MKLINNISKIKRYYYIFFNNFFNNSILVIGVKGIKILDLRYKKENLDF